MSETCWKQQKTKEKNVSALKAVSAGFNNASLSLHSNIGYTDFFNIIS